MLPVPIGCQLASEPRKSLMSADKNTKHKERIWKMAISQVQNLGLTMTHSCGNLSLKANACVSKEGTFSFFALVDHLVTACTVCIALRSTSN